MKTLTNLSFTVTDEHVTEPRGIISAVHEEPAPGIHRVIQLGSAGLFIKRGEHVVCIPRAALMQAACEADPALRPPHSASEERGLQSAGTAALAAKIASTTRTGSPVKKLALALLLLSSIFHLPSSALAQLMFPKTNILSSYTNLLAGSNYSPNSVVSLYRDRGFALIATAVATNASEVGPLRLSFQFTGDGSNYTTTTPLTWTFALNGTNYVRAYTNFPAAVVDNIRFAKWTLTTNMLGTNGTTIQISNVISYIVP